MHLIDSILQLLTTLRHSYELYCNTCKQSKEIFPRFLNFPHEVITFLLYNIRFQKSSKCSLEFLFLEFIRLGYNPFRKDATYTERIMAKSIISIIDKSNGYAKEKKNK